MATRPIDEKIVAMKMDNSDFKQKAIETTSLFGKLRENLGRVSAVGLDKTTQALTNVKSAAANVDMNQLARNVETVASRFSNLGIVATTALMNITNRAVDAGIALYRSLTVDPVMDGFREYENKMSSIGTMLANTEWAGSTLDDVKKTLGELNDYADNTIYSFEQMTANIGRFTAAGVTLEDSAIAIKGLGNLAAVSGSDVNQLNTVMYQMSQALAAGKLNLMDWNSLVNGGMAGKKTQDALVATAKAMGKNVDLSDGFRNSIEQGWLTSEVFLETLKKFGKDESMTKAATSVRTFTGMIAALREGVGSGWATTWELIFGDFEVATKRWTAVSQVIGGFFQKSTDARNKFVKTLADHGVFQAFFDVFIDTGGAVLKVLGAIGNGIKKAFGVLSIDGIVKMAASFKDFAISLKPSEETLDKISTVAQAAFSILRMVVGVAITLGKALIDMIPPGLGTATLNILETFARMVLAFTESVIAGRDVSSTASGMAGVLGALGGAVGALVLGFEKLSSVVAEAWNILVNGNYTGKGPWEEDSAIVDWLFTIREGFQELGSYLKSLDFSSVLIPLTNGFKYLGESVSSMSFNLEPVSNAFSKFFDLIASGYEWVKEKLAGVGQAITDALPSGNKLLAGGFVAGLVAVVGMTLKMAWDLYEVFTGWGKIGQGVSDVLEGVGGALEGFGRAMTANAIATTVISVAIGVGLLAVALKLLSTIDPDRIGTSLTALVTSLTGLIGAMAIMTKYDISGQGIRTAITLIGLSVAFAILSGALKKIADLSWVDISKGIVGLAGVLGSLSLALALMGNFGGTKVGASALQIMAVAVAVHILLSAVKKIASINVGALTKGIATMGIILLELGIFMRLVSGTKFGVGSTLGMLAVGQAIENMAGAIQKIAKIDVKSLVVGLTTITLILAQITLFTRLTSDMGLLSAGVGMLILSAAITALIVPIGILGNMNMSTLAKGLGAMAVALLAIGVASKLMMGMAVAGFGLLLVAGALTALLVPIGAFAAMGWGPMLTGLAGLALTLGVIGGVTLLLAPAIPLLTAFGLGILALGAGMALAGIAFPLFATGLMTLATMTAGAVTTIVAVLGTLIMGLASLIPTAVDFIVKLIVQIATAIAENAPIIGAKIAELVIGLLGVLTIYLPKFIEKGVEFILKLLEGLGSAIPQLINGAIEFMVDLVEGMANALRNNGERLITAMMELMGEIIILVIQAGTQVIRALFGWIPGVNDAMTEVGTKAEQAVRDSFGAREAGQDKGKDFANALGSKSGDARTAGAKVSEAGKSGVDSANIKTIGTEKGQDFATALANKASAAKTSGTNLAEAGKDGAGSVSMSTTGSNFGEGFAGGISSAYDSVVSAAKSLAKAAKEKVEDWLDMHSPSREMFKDGGWFGEGFALGIRDKIKRVGSSAKDLAITARDSLNQFLEGFEIPEEDNELHFKAVIDYESLNVSKFGNVSPLRFAPDTSTTNRLVSATKYNQDMAKAAQINNTSNSNNTKVQEPIVKQPAVIQVVTPDKREVARWIVDDVTEFQDFKIATSNKF